MKSGPELRLSARARRDIRAILQHSADVWGERQQSVYAQALDTVLQMLAEYPLLGRKRDSIFRGCRSKVVEQHVIYYHLREDGSMLIIDRILHSKMDPSQVEEQTA